MWQTLIAPVGQILGDIVSGWRRRSEIETQGRVEIRQAEIQAEVERARSGANLIQSEQQHAAVWELEAQRAASKSFKDEAWTYCVIAVMAICFVPGLAPYAALGFQVLSTAPGWFQLVVGASVAYSFGLRQLVMLIRDAWKR